VIHAGWEAELRLSFVRDGQRTVLHERSHRGPLRVQRPFYPEGDSVCHVYVLHPPGGLVGGDRTSLQVVAEAGAHALLTTPAASKLYRSGGPRSIQSQHLTVGSTACIEWLPLETIAFDGANAELNTQVDLESDGRFLGWEVLCLGRPAAQELFSRGELRPSIELTRAGKPLYVERGSYTGGSALLGAPWGLGAQPVVGTFLCAASGAAECIEAARRIALPESPAIAAVSGWGELLLARYLGPSAEQAREFFTSLWVELRPTLLGVPAQMPRIWRT
jgi:urease accessory protein